MHCILYTGVDILLAKVNLIFFTVAIAIGRNTFIVGQKGTRKLVFAKLFVKNALIVFTSHQMILRSHFAEKQFLLGYL